MKSTNLDNAPTQSLLTFVNGILDEIIENKNGEIPYVGYSKAMQLVVSVHTLNVWYILFYTFSVLLNEKNIILCTAYCLLVEKGNTGD